MEINFCDGFEQKFKAIHWRAPFVASAVLCIRCTHRRCSSLHSALSAARSLPRAVYGTFGSYIACVDDQLTWNRASCSKRMSPIWSCCFSMALLHSCALFRARQVRMRTTATYLLAFIYHVCCVAYVLRKAARLSSTRRCSSDLPAAHSRIPQCKVILHFIVLTSQN